MKKLALHYEKIRSLYPEDMLMILFDIDGTILDMRYMIHCVLKDFDRKHDTSFFESLKASDIDVHENQVGKLLSQLRMRREQREKILSWYLEKRWSSTAVLESHRPFSGVMECIRWFQIQPNTYVGLNSGRPETIRSDTMRSLNELGKEYKVKFTNDMLYMNPHGWDKEVANSKVSGIKHFQDSGYRIFAFIDNEPENLKGISEFNTNQNILLLHADTIFESKRKRLPSNTVQGKKYDITELIHEKALPQHIQFVWHGINDEANLRQFIASTIQWAELDVRLDPSGEDLILRHDSFNETSLQLQEDEEFLFLDDILSRFKNTGKSLKLDIKETGSAIDKILESLHFHKFNNLHLWFNGKVEVLKEAGFRKLKSKYPEAIIQCPINFLSSLILSVPEEALEMLNLFSGWGINRFSISWKIPEMKRLLDQLDKWGFDVNIYNVPDLESFLKAVLLLPRSITTDFNFPKWHYFGRGSGENRNYYRYLMQTPA